MNVLPQPQPLAFDNLMRAQGLALHTRDLPPPDKAAWQERRARLRAALFAAMGPFPEKPCPLEPREHGALKRDGYRVEKLTFQSRPDVWVTASAYVPDPARGKLPAVLVVHGHWPWARRDPVVQARCIGLAKLGFVALAVDAFGAGERYTTPGRGTYHGALYGSTLWPTGQTLLGMQVYDNRRAVDYLLTRPEVDGSRLGVTGASGGGNQSMYAGALDERLQAVVPVCSVGTYQSYLHAACCVCEVLPGGLRLAEEGDVLALVAPRALLVVNATKDAFQFSVAEARKSLDRARPVFKLYGEEARLGHAVFESGHAYSQPMREAMYGWMARWLKSEGDGKPIPEPAHEVEKPEDLSCFPNGEHPKGFLFPPSYAAREAKAVLADVEAEKPSHVQEWESTVTFRRQQLRQRVFGDFTKPPRPVGKLGKAETADGVQTTPLLLHPEPDMPLPVLLRGKPSGAGKQPVGVLLHLDGKDAALQSPLAAALVKAGWLVAAPDLRATGETRAASDTIANAPDHNSAEHALWVGRPLLGQWVFDVQCLLDWVLMQPTVDKTRVAVAGLGQAGVVAVCAAALDERVTAAANLDGPISYVTDAAYPAGTRMGLLAPGILRVGDIPHLAALAAPRRLVVVNGTTAQGRKLTEPQLLERFAYTRAVYRVHRAEEKLKLTDTTTPDEVVRWL